MTEKNPQSETKKQIFKHQGYALKAEVMRSLVRIERLRFSVTASRSRVVHHYASDEGAVAERESTRYGLAIQAFGWTWATYADRRETTLHRPTPTWDTVLASTRNALADFVWYLAE